MRLLGRNVTCSLQLCVRFSALPSILSTSPSLLGGLLRFGVHLLDQFWDAEVHLLNDGDDFVRVAPDVGLCAPAAEQRKGIRNEPLSYELM